VKRIVFSELARADLRRPDRDTAKRVLSAFNRLAETGQGDIKRLKGEAKEFRLRAGDYRVRFTEESDTLHINRVLHRKEACR